MIDQLTLDQQRIFDATFLFLKKINVKADDIAIINIRSINNRLPNENVMSFRRYKALVSKEANDRKTKMINNKIAKLNNKIDRLERESEKHEDVIAEVEYKVIPTRMIEEKQYYMLANADAEITRLTVELEEIKKSKDELKLMIDKTAKYTLDTIPELDEKHNTTNEINSQSQTIISMMDTASQCLLDLKDSSTMTDMDESKLDMSLEDKLNVKIQDMSKLSKLPIITPELAVHKYYLNEFKFRRLFDTCGKLVELDAFIIKKDWDNCVKNKGRCDAIILLLDHYRENFKETLIKMVNSD